MLPPLPRVLRILGAVKVSPRALLSGATTASTASASTRPFIPQSYRSLGPADMYERKESGFIIPLALSEAVLFAEHPHDASAACPLAVLGKEC